MLVNIYAILDIKAQIYGLPIQEHNHGTAIRAFQTAARTPNSPYNDYPLDYLLMHLATYNNTTGQIEPLEAPLRIWSAQEAIGDPSVIQGGEDPGRESATLPGNNGNPNHLTQMEIK